MLGDGEGGEDCKGFGFDVTEVYALICGQYAKFIAVRVEKDDYLALRAEEVHPHSPLFQMRQAFKMLSATMALPKY